MKKKLLVAALVASFAGFTGVAQADSVVLYGTLDGGLGFNTYTIKQNVKNVQTTTAAGRGFAFENGVNEGSVLGFKGDAFIWGQTSALFKLESNLNILNGAGGKFDGGVSKLFDGGIYFGFTGPSWGTFTAGYQDSASGEFAVTPFSNFAIGSALPGGKLGDIVPSNLFQGGAFGNMSGGLSSNIKYVTPRFAGFKLAVSHDFDIQFLGDPVNNEDAVKYRLATYKAGEQTSLSHQHTSVGLDFAMGPVELAATYDIYSPVGKNYKFDYAGNAVSPDKNAKNAEQAYTVGATVDIRGIQVTATWGQAFSHTAFAFGINSNVGGNISSSLYQEFFNDAYKDKTTGKVIVTGVTEKYRNNSFGASITIPATEQGTFYFAYTGSIATADRVHGLLADPTQLDPKQPSTKVKAFAQLWRAGYVQNISQYTSLYVYAGFGDVKFSEKPVDQSGWKDSNEVGTARLQQYGIGITHNF